MNKSRSDIIFEKLIDMIENGQTMPLSTGKVVVNKDEAITLVKELESLVKGELKIYREVNDRRGKIINEAKKEAEDIVYEAEQAASRIRVTKRMSNFGTAFRPEKLSIDEKHALRTANDIYAASLIYTDEMLTEVNDMVAEAYDLMTSQYNRVIKNLEDKATQIAANKAELMQNLKELSKEERYTQILELSQLLSNELYIERNKAKEMDKNGSYQMELKLDAVIEDESVKAAPEIKASDEVETMEDVKPVDSVKEVDESRTPARPPVKATKSIELSEQDIFSRG